MEEKKEKQGKWIMEERHYKAVSQWLERAALLFAASLVVQKIVAGATISDPVVIAGAVSALVIYAAAYIMLLRS
jgi:hypothetical protein